MFFDIWIHGCATSRSLVDIGVRVRIYYSFQRGWGAPCSPWFAGEIGVVDFDPGSLTIMIIRRLGPLGGACIILIAKIGSAEFPSPIVFSQRCQAVLGMGAPFFPFPWWRLRFVPLPDFSCAGNTSTGFLSQNPFPHPRLLALTIFAPSSRLH